MDFGSVLRRQVLIIPDKFKGTLTAHQAAEAIARGWRQARPSDSLTLLPMTDGGDGFGAVMSDLLGAKAQSVRTIDAAGRPCTARWWWATESRTAILEAATVIGLARLPARRFHPFELDTFGLGAVFRAAIRKGPAITLVGIGGSATNDGGFGLARALGWRFRDRHQAEIQDWPRLEAVHQLLPPPQPLCPGNVIVAVDVQNPLLGPCGATRVYGPQKGLTSTDYPKAEAALRGLARLVNVHCRSDFAAQPGAGAAGGLGFGLLAFAGGRLQPGFRLFAQHASLTEHLQASDMVVTAEGAIDRSSLMGKGVGEIARRCHALHLPCIGLAGLVELTANARRRFARCAALLELTSLAQAQSRPAYWLQQLAGRVAAELGTTPFNAIGRSLPEGSEAGRVHTA